MELITAVVVEIMATGGLYRSRSPSPLSIVCVRILQPIFPFI